MSRCTIGESDALSLGGHDRTAVVTLTIGLTRVGEGKGKINVSTDGAGDDDSASKDCVPLVRLWFAERFGGDGAVEGTATAEQLFGDKQAVLDWLRGLAVTQAPA